MPFDTARPGRQAQSQHRRFRPLRHDLHRRQPERRRKLLIGQRLGRLRRLARQAERCDQAGQRLLARLVPDPERIDMACCDAEEIRNLA